MARPVGIQGGPMGRSLCFRPTQTEGKKAVINPGGRGAAGPATTVWGVDEQLSPLRDGLRYYYEQLTAGIGLGSARAAGVYTIIST